MSSKIDEVNVTNDKHNLVPNGTSPLCVIHAPLLSFKLLSIADLFFLSNQINVDWFSDSKEKEDKGKATREDSMSS